MEQAKEDRGYKIALRATTRSFIFHMPYFISYLAYEIWHMKYEGYQPHRAHTHVSLWRCDDGKGHCSGLASSRRPGAVRVVCPRLARIRAARRVRSRPDPTACRLRLHLGGRARKDGPHPDGRADHQP